MKSLIIIVTSVSALPSVVPIEDSYCVANGFASDSNTICSSGDALITESDLLNNGLSFVQKYKSIEFIQTNSPIKASYLATGTANYFTMFPELLYNGKIISSNTNGISLNNRGKDAFDYLNKNNIQSIVDIIIKRIEIIVSLGANAIRFDELDTCTDNTCMENYILVYKNILNYMIEHSISVIGNNNSNRIEHLPTIANITSDSNVHIAGWIVESGQTLSDLLELHDVLGEQVFIYAICSSGDCETDDGKSYNTISIFKSISYYDY
jgi:hypothetical protein